MKNKFRQRLTSGVLIEQFPEDYIRPILFETEYEGWEYATDGGTAFLVNYENRIYGITCKHVFKSFDAGKLAIINCRNDKLVAAIESIAFLKEPKDDADGSDIMDLAIIIFDDSVDSTFFKGDSYTLRQETFGVSRKGDRLLINGYLKDGTDIDQEKIKVVLNRFEAEDTDRYTHDTALRTAKGSTNQTIKNLNGLSGAPVFNLSAQRLSGMAVRGGFLEGGEAFNIYYVDCYDIMHALKGVHEGKHSIYYTKDMPQ